MLRRLIDQSKKLAEVVSLEPSPLRFAAQQLLRRTPIGDVFPYTWRMRFGGLPRAHYAFCMQRGAQLAASLGIDRISAIEFGVAGGNGLLTMEAHARALEKQYAVRFDLYGFDLESGLPHSESARDLPYRWHEGLFPMDREQLQGKLSRSTLLLGNVNETLGRFVVEHSPAPVAMIAFDLDYYSSTRAALRVFDINARFRLPRISCYFDDITDTISQIGVLKAIGEWNDEHPDAPLDVIRGNLLGFRVQPAWKDYVYECHDLKHPLYTQCTRTNASGLPLFQVRPQ